LSVIPGEPLRFAGRVEGEVAIREEGQMPRLSSGRHRKQATVGLAALLGVAGVTATAIALSSPAGNAAEAPKENCAGLDTALRNNLNFIAGQQANPDAQSAARITNRVAADGQAAAAPGNSGNAPGKAQAPGQQKKQEAAATGDVVCPGSTVTLSGEGGAPAAPSNQFPAGTKLKVTNLDNSKSTTVEVTSVSGSCALLNNAAFEQVREPGKFLIRRARIERVG
jgi:hypothetical protein